MRRVGKGFGTLFALAVLAGGLLRPPRPPCPPCPLRPPHPQRPPPRLADVTSSASIHPQFPDIDTLRVGIIAFVRPSPFEAVVDPTLAQLARTFGEDRIEVTHYTLPELAQAVRKGEVDVFLASSGFFVRLVADGARSLATVVSRDYPDPNHNDGSAPGRFGEPRGSRDVGRPEGKRLLTSTKDGFTSAQVPLAENRPLGIRPESSSRPSPPWAAAGGSTRRSTFCAKAKPTS